MNGLCATSILRGLDLTIVLDELPYESPKQVGMAGCGHAMWILEVSITISLLEGICPLHVSPKGNIFRFVEVEVEAVLS